MGDPWQDQIKYSYFSRVMVQIERSILNSYSLVQLRWVQLYWVQLHWAQLPWVHLSWGCNSVWGNCYGLICLGRNCIGAIVLVVITCSLSSTVNMLTWILNITDEWTSVVCLVFVILPKLIFPKSNNFNRSVSKFAQKYANIKLPTFWLLDLNCTLLVKDLSLMMTIIYSYLDVDEIYCPLRTNYEKIFCGNFTIYNCSQNCGDFMVQFDKHKGGWVV